MTAVSRAYRRGVVLGMTSHSRRIGILASVFAIFIVTMTPLASARGRTPPPPPPPPAPRLLWADEFTTATLNPANWTIQTGGGGQYGDDLTVYQPQNVSTVNGSLALTATADATTTPVTYNSGRVVSTYRVNSPSYTEARIFIPYGQGYWPAFWLLGDSSKGNYTEFDIMESINSEHIDYSTYWLGNTPLYASAQNRGTGQASALDGWHTYGFEWTTTGVATYLDGVKISSAPLRVSRSMQIILNLAVGGSWPGSPDATTVFPQSMSIDYVRVYSAKPA